MASKIAFTKTIRSVKITHKHVSQNCQTGFAKERDIVCDVDYCGICPIAKFMLNTLGDMRKEGRTVKNQLFHDLTLLSPSPSPTKRFFFTCILFATFVRLDRCPMFTNFTTVLANAAIV